MLKTTVYNQAGEKVKDLELNPAVFGITPKPDVMQHAVVVQQANARFNFAHAKDRSEVRGGGKKPWQQKGTGRARHGSSRSPIWRGGGVTFGPTKNQNFSLKINKKVKRQAILMGLSDKAINNHLILLDNLVLAEAKTKKFFEVLQNLQLRKKAVKKTAKKSEDKTAKAERTNESILVVLPKKDEKVKRAASNVPKVVTILADSLNVVDVMKYKKILMLVDSIEVIQKTFASTVVKTPTVAKTSGGKSKVKKSGVKK